MPEAGKYRVPPGLYENYKKRGSELGAEIYSDEEMAKFARWFKEYRFDPRFFQQAHFLGLVLFGAGLRSGEARTLTLDQCKLNPVPTVTIISQKGRSAKRVTRTVAILPQYREYFRDWIMILRKGSEIFGHKNVFTASWDHQKNKALGIGLHTVAPRWKHRTRRADRNKLSTVPCRTRPAIWWRTAEVEAGVTISPYGVKKGRRTWATYAARMLFDAGNGRLAPLSPWDLARQMGHSNLDTVRRFYDAAPAHMRFPSDYSATWAEELAEYSPYEDDIVIAGSQVTKPKKIFRIVAEEVGRT